MVKSKTHFAILLLAICSLASLGCSLRSPFVDVKSESLLLSNGPAAPFLSLVDFQGALYAVFANRSTTTLDMVVLPEGPHLPSVAPAAEVIDKVDIAPPMSSAFGEHVLCVAGGSASVLYLDRRSDVKSVLKLATRKLAEKQWYLDLLEPVGDPLQLDFDDRGGLGATWSSGILMHRPPAQSNATAQPIAFKLEGRTCPDGSGGFTAFDSLTSQLLALHWRGSGFSVQTIPGGTPVQACLRSIGGLLRVVAWEPKVRTLVLHRETASGGVFSSSTVTLCDGTQTIALLPGQSDETFLVIFDEVRSLGAGKTVSQVSLIAPGSLLGAWGTRYRKTVLCSGNSCIDGFAAVRTADALYVLVSQGNLRLMRIPLAK
jgi:hypothetical protein